MSIKPAGYTHITLWENFKIDRGLFIRGNTMKGSKKEYIFDYKKINTFKISYTIFSNILQTFNKLIVDKCIEGKIVNFKGLGSMRVLCVVDAKYCLDENRDYKFRVNAGATLKEKKN